MTPMLDIVFIMLIFFIVTASFVKESGIDVNRPTAKTATRQEQGNIIVAIKPNGDIWINKQQVDLAAVRAKVRRLHAEQPLGSVVIAADKQVRVQTLTEVMDKIRQAGIMNASIATTNE